MIKNDHLLYENKYPYFHIKIFSNYIVNMNFNDINELENEHVHKHYKTDIIYNKNNKNDIIYFVVPIKIANFLIKYNNELNITKTFIYDQKIHFVFDIGPLSKKQKNIIKMINQSVLIEKKSILQNSLFDSRAYIVDAIWKEKCYILCDHNYAKLPTFIMNEIYNRYMEIYHGKKPIEIKLENTKEIYKLSNDFIKNGWTDTKCAELYYLLARDKFIYDEINKTWYVMNKYNIWKKNKDGSKIIADLTKLLAPILTEHFNKITFSKNISQLEKEIYLINFPKIIKCLGSNTHKKHVLDELKGLCDEEKVFERMDNVNPYLFAFDNGVYDFQNKVFRLPKSEELITCTCGYNYEEKNKSIQKAIDDIYEITKSMMECQDDKDTILTTIALRLVAVIMKEGFDILLGQGGNGKGVLRDLIANTFGSYFDPMEIEYLIKSKHGQSATAADEVMARKKNCRIVISTEPESDIEIRIGKIKQWSGRDPIQCRFNFGSCFNFVPKFRLMIQSNFPIIVKNAGKSITRRINVYKFPYNFTDVPVLTNDKLEDVDLKNRICQDEYKIAFFYVLLDYYIKWEENGKKIIRSENVIKQTELFLADNDPVTPFFEAIIIKNGDDKLFVKSSELYQSFKQFYYGENKHLNIQEFRTALEGKGIVPKLLHGTSIYRGIQINHDKLKQYMKEKKKNEDIDLENNN